MHTALLRRLIVAFVGVLGILAAGWITASRTAPEASLTAADAQAACDVSACAETCPADVTPATAVVAAAEEAPGPRAAGMVAYLDPETGEIGGVPPGGVEDALMVNPGTRVTTDGTASDGSPMQITNGAFDEYAVMHLDAKGNLRMACGPDAKALLAAPLPAPTPEEK
jgi:hypothetical protein